MTRPTPRPLVFALTGLAAFAWVVATATTAAAGPIEAVKGKTYRLTEAHGPWMIMAATFHEPAAGVTEDGLTPAEAADELVFELRKAGLPAYTYTQDETYLDTAAGDTLGGASPGRYRLKLGEVCVLAGNYQTKHQAGEKPNAIADLYGPCRVGQRSLAWVKRFSPKFLTEGDELADGTIRLTSGGVIRRTPGQPTALAGAFLTINPLLDPASIRTGLTPLVESLNDRRRNPNTLAGCPGRFSLVVKTFKPTSTLTTAESVEPSRSDVRQASFLGGLFGGDRQLPELVKLEAEASAFAAALQNSKLTKQFGVPTFVWHEADYSVVTVGAFDDRNDPRIAKLAQALGAKSKIDPVSGREVIAAELLPDPRGGGRGNAHGWILDPQPSVIEVPAEG